jgi:hypothetical protein
MDAGPQLENSASPPPRHAAAELGLASALIGATVFLAAPLVAILAAQIWAHADRTPAAAALHAWLARFAVAVPILLVGFGAWMGIAGLRQAWRDGRSAALPLAGLLLNVSACCGWALAGIGLLNTTESMLWLAR